MPVYTGFNLATQGRGGQTPNATTNYYSGLNRPNPIGNQLGNNTGTPPPNAGTGTTPTQFFNGGGWQQGQDAIPYLQQYLGNRNPNGSAGFNIENAFRNGTGTPDPRLSQYGLTRVGEHEEGGGRWELQGDRTGVRDINGVRHVQAGEFLNRIIDPTKVFYDDEFGLMTTPDNISNPESNLSKAMPFVAAAAFGLPTLAHAGAFSSFGVPGAEAANVGVGTGSQIGVPNAAGELVGTGSQVGVPSAAGELAANTAATSGLPPPGSLAGTTVAGPVGYEGAGAAATAAGTPSGSSLPFGLTGRDLATAGAGVFNVLNSRNADRNTNEAADRADPFGRYRQQAGDDLMNFMNDPNYIYQRPGYLARQAQGEQGINRAAAGKGYFRSPNMLFDLSKFNSGLAAQEFDAEYRRLAAMAGVDVNPAPAANILADGRSASTNMRTSGYTQLAGGFLDWLTRG